MNTLLTLFSISLLLTTGACLKCEICTNIGKTCDGIKAACPAGRYTCGAILTEAKIGGTSTFGIAKSCILKSDCNKVMKAKLHGLAGISRVMCNKAPSTVASLILCLSGLLLVKILL